MDMNHSPDAAAKAAATTQGPSTCRAKCDCNRQDDLDYEELDPGIAWTVKFLREAGVHTVSSCEGGDGHPYDEPMVRFRGDPAEAKRVAELTWREGLFPFEISRAWHVSGDLGDDDDGDDEDGNDGECLVTSIGPFEEIGFWSIFFDAEYHAVTVRQNERHEQLPKS
jgi:hypothetical protein